MTRIPMMRASAIALLVYVAIMFGFLGGAVHATPHQKSASSASLTLSITNGSSFEYNSTITPHFIGTVSLVAPLPPNAIKSGQIIISNGQIIQFTGFVTSQDQLTINENTNNGSDTTTGAPISIGDLTAYATFKYTDSVTNTSGSLQSLPIQFSITKDRFNLSCNSTTLQRIIKPGVPAQFQFTADNSNQSVPLDWTQGLASITFLGPSTTTTSNLQLDSSGMVTVTAPPAVGRYNMTCTFSGTTYYAPESVTWSTYPVLVSDMSPLGSVQVYSNPSTIAPNQPIQLYIVFKAAPGLPTPSGQFSITIGSGSGFYYTNGITIRADGTAMVNLSPIRYVDKSWPLSITYYGDGYYDNQTVNFTLTNPPIPGSGGGSGGSGTSGTGGTSPKATATPKATVTPKPTATVKQTATAGANSTTSSGTQPAAPSASHWSHVGVFSMFGPAAGVALWIVIILCVALAGGFGYGVFYWLSYRTRIASAPIGQADTTADASSPWNASSPDE